MLVVDGADSEQEAKTYGQFVKKYKHKFLDLNDQHNAQFVESEYHKLLERRLREQEKSLSEQKNNFGVIQKQNGHYGFVSVPCREDEGPNPAAAQAEGVQAVEADRQRKALEG